MLAELVLIIHTLYVLFVVLGIVLIIIGASLKWQWIRSKVFRIVHLASITIVAIEALIGITCPLTNLEYCLRSDSSVERIGLIARILRKIIFYDFPPIFFILLYLGTTGVVILLYIKYPPRKNS